MDGVCWAHAQFDTVCVQGEPTDTLSAMRDVTSPVLDPADAGRGELRALQALLLGLLSLLIL